MKRSKAYRDAAAKIDHDQLYSPLAGVRLAKETSVAKYDATVEVAFRLGVDPRKADQMVRGTVNLPHGTGKVARVIVFATGPRAEAAVAAGADEVGGDELIERVAGGFIDFDAAVATPDLMGKVGRLGRVLGPRGLMPNPKTGTVTMDVAKAVTEIKGGKIEFRTDKHGRTTRRRSTRCCGSSRRRPRAGTWPRRPSRRPRAPACRSTRPARATCSSRSPSAPDDAGPLPLLGSPDAACAPRRRRPGSPAPSGGTGARW